jgi:hypothetical protein
MPIKKIHVGFDIDMDVFMKMLQHGSSGVRVDFLGDTPKQPKGPKLLEAPKRVGTKNIVMDFAKARKDDGFAPKELAPLIEAAGYSPTSHSPALVWLTARGFLKRKDGVYFATTKGMTYES